MTRKVLSNTPSIVILRRIFLLIFQSLAGNRRKHIPAVTRIKQKFIKCLSTDWLVFNTQSCWTYTQENKNSSQMSYNNWRKEAWRNLSYDRIRTCNSRMLVGCCYVMRYKTACESVRHNNFKATLSFRGSTSSSRCIATASLFSNNVISTKLTYITMSDFGTWLKVLNKFREIMFGRPIWRTYSRSYSFCRQD